MSENDKKKDFKKSNENISRSITDGVYFPGNEWDSRKSAKEPLKKKKSEK